MFQPIWAALKNAINQVIAESPKHLAHEVADRIADHMNERHAQAKERADLARPPAKPSEAVGKPRQRSPRSN